MRPKNYDLFFRHIYILSTQELLLFWFISLHYWREGGITQVFNSKSEIFELFSLSIKFKTKFHFIQHFLKSWNTENNYFCLDLVTLRTTYPHHHCLQSLCPGKKSKLKLKHTRTNVFKLPNQCFISSARVHEVQNIWLERMSQTLTTPLSLLINYYLLNIKNMIHVLTPTSGPSIPIPPMLFIIWKIILYKIETKLPVTHLSTRVVSLCFLISRPHCRIVRSNCGENNGPPIS